MGANTVTQAMMAQDGKISLQYRCPPTGSEVTDQFNLALESIQASLLDMQSASEQMSVDAAQLLNDGQQLIDSMQHKMDQVERIAAATGQMSAGSEHTSQMSQEAETAAIDASDAVRQGTETAQHSQDSVKKLAHELTIAKDTVSKMAGSVEEIKAVLDVINKISEQTNLLALNAAIEAARAGEQGRGFAVVADEVRTLASQTRGSTEQIQETISSLVDSSNASVQSVQKCFTFADDSMKSVNDNEALLDTIETRAQHVRDSIREIASALEEQANASNEIANSTQTLTDLEERQADQSSEVVNRARSVESVSDNLRRLSNKFIA